MCRVVNADAYTLILVAWATLQLTWITMLLFVQLVQVSRAMTTYENMMGAHHGHDSKAAEAITSALTTGTTSRAGAQLGATGLGTDPALPQAHGHGHHGHHHHQQGCFAQWKKILGVDTFVETALHGTSGTRNRTRHNRNPFSAGCVQNCRDFWCDPSPVFGRRENGAAVLGGAVVNYTTMYESPRLMRMRAGGGDTAGTYQAVAADDPV
jgi:palmitoyltransferase